MANSNSFIPTIILHSKHMHLQPFFFRLVVLGPPQFSFFKGEHRQPPGVCIVRKDTSTNTCSCGQVVGSMEQRAVPFYNIQVPLIRGVLSELLSQRYNHNVHACGLSLTGDVKDIGKKI